MTAEGAVPEGEARVLVVDGTGRGHAICDLLVRTNPDVVVYYGPGCDVIADERITPVPSISLTDPGTALRFLAEHPVELVLVSNIDALSIGYADVLRAHGHAVIGPSREAAALESSKDRGKRFCADHGIPTAAYRSFTDPAAARAYIRALPYACVVKADGLQADGDGAVVCDTGDQAIAAVDRFAARFGDEFRVVVERRLHGTEISVFALLDGAGYVLFPPAVDFKRTLDGDAGVNCDGMGSIAPHPADGPLLREELRARLLDPLVAGLAAEGLHFTGFVYIGAMITDAGLAVVEINARFGDSEAEVVLPSVRSDFLQLCRATLAGTAHRHCLVTDDLVRCSVALTQGCVDAGDPDAAPGWPFGEVPVGQRVTGLDAVDGDEVRLFYANLRRGADGAPVTCGGRVLHVVGHGRSVREARERAYRQIPRVRFAGVRYRMDIGAGLPRPRAGAASDAVATTAWWRSLTARAPAHAGSPTVLEPELPLPVPSVAGL